MSADWIDAIAPCGAVEALAPGALLLRGFAREHTAELIGCVRAVTAAAPLRHMVTPGGFRMSVAMSNCGTLGWVTDPSGYRYTAVDPQTSRPWPALPGAIDVLARAAAARAGYADFRPDACLINHYAPGARMSLHQDRNERDFAAPIVSVSLGLPAVFLFGGLRRAERPRRVRLLSGDVVVWGGPSRLAYHGVAPLAAGTDPLTGASRYNLTLRRAG